MSVLKNKIVHCKTEEQAKKLMQIADNEGYFWHNGLKATEENYYYYLSKGNGMLYFFDSYEENMITYLRFEGALDIEIERMIEFEDLLTEDYDKGNTKITNSNTTLGEKILVKDQEDDDWQERYFLTVAHGLIYTTATEDGRYPFAWKYGIKKEY